MKGVNGLSRLVWWEWVVVDSFFFFLAFVELEI